MKTYEKVIYTVLSSLTLFLLIWAVGEIVLIRQAARSPNMTEVTVGTIDTVGRHGISGHHAKLMVWSTSKGRSGLHTDTCMSSRYEAFTEAQRMVNPKRLQLDSSSTSIKIGKLDTVYSTTTVYKVTDR